MPDPGKREQPHRRGLLGTGIDKVAGAVVPVVTRSLDADELLERIDVDAMLERVDLNAMLERIDVDQLISRIDVNAIVQRVDIDALLQRVDIDDLMARAEIGEMISRSTGQVATRTIDLVRRQLVGLDVITLRVVNRVLRRDPATVPVGPPSLVGGPP